MKTKEEKPKKKKSPASKMFPINKGMYERYKEMKDSDPYKQVRENYARNYNRQPWTRKESKNKKAKDANFGQFQGKINRAMNMFMGVLTERRMFVKVIPKYAEEGTTKDLTDKISSAFHRYFMKPWQKRFMIEAFCVRDMVFAGKGIEHWSNKGCFETKNIPVERVFPDTNAGLLSSSWGYVFIEEPFTICELLHIHSKQEKAMSEEGYDAKDNEFNHKFLSDIIDNISHYSETTDNSDASKEIKGDHSSSNADETVILVYAYIKDYNDPDLPVSRYIFPGKVKEDKNNTSTTIPENSTTGNMRFLSKESGYAKCISEHVHVRFFQIERSYWKYNSLAKQIYLATMLYDKSMSLILRAAKRSLILYFKSSDRKTQQKLLAQTDDEVQVIDEGTSYVTTSQVTNIDQMMQTVRQVMIDTENEMSMTQASGSQNVKGYAITSAEAKINDRRQSDQESLNFKVLMANDSSLYQELYRRAINGDSEEYSKALKAFKKEMKRKGVEEEFYDPDNVYFAPNYLSGGLQNAQQVYATLLQQASTPGQEQAQKDVIGSLVGYENVDDYLPMKETIDPVVIQVGNENENLDSPTVNPKNVPVLPSDKHMKHIPIHVADYELKLQMVQNILKVAQQEQNPLSSLTFVMFAMNLIIAQDNKGAHIQGHINAVSNSKENIQALTPVLQKFAEIQKMQNQLTETATQMKDKILQATQASSMHDEELRFKKAMNDLDIKHKTDSNDIAVAKQVEQKQAAQERSQFNMEKDVEKKGIDLASKEESAKLDLQIKQTENEIKKAKAKTSPE